MKVSSDIAHIPVFTILPTTSEVPILNKSSCQEYFLCRNPSESRHNYLNNM